mmetsp:Transcript_13667/g.18703  ORF Transcript_13667/g.18703 Transcript_13667/m.18703 type:complete len:95 (+) Transcript_13667:1508-1792(+)
MHSTLTSCGFYIPWATLQLKVEKVPSSEVEIVWHLDDYNSLGLENDGICGEDDREDTQRRRENIDLPPSAYMIREARGLSQKKIKIISVMMCLQ